MPVITQMPGDETIGALHGVLDFYYWKGLACVRKWPYTPMANRTRASLDSAHLFGAIVQGWALVGAAIKDLYNADAADQNRTGRDLYVSGVLGHLHVRS